METKRKDLRFINDILEVAWVAVRNDRYETALNELRDCIEFLKLKERGWGGYHTLNLSVKEVVVLMKTNNFLGAELKIESARRLTSHYINRL